MIIVKYIIVTIVPIVVILLFILVKRKVRFKKNKKNFWNRQNKKALQKFNLLKLKEIPEPLNLISQLESLQTTIQAVSLSISLGLIDFIKSKSEVTKEDIQNFLDMDKHIVNALLEIFLANNIVIKKGIGYGLTKRGELYLSKESPLFQPLPVTLLGKRFFKLIKKRSGKSAINKWSKGKATKAENWALRQHQYSFPLGFALANMNIVKGKNILDVAGGTGAICIALAISNPDLYLSVIELPSSIGITEKMISNYQLSDRIKCIGMDMFVDEWPRNMDTILFTNIFHDWSDEHCKILSQKAFDSLQPGGIVLIQEALFNDDKPGPLWTAHWSMAMALTMEGKQFHFTELKSILEDAGFISIEKFHLQGYYSTIKAVKPI